MLRYDITAGSSKTLNIYTDSELAVSNDFGLAYDEKNLQSANELLTNFEPQDAETFQTGIINLLRYRNLYLTCPTLSNYTTISPSGNANVIKKIPVNADYGSFIYCNRFAVHDYIDVSALLLTRLVFRICDSYGKVVNLRGVPVSFSLIFMPRE